MVDGSPPPVFAAHAAAWHDLPLRHLRPDGDLDFAMGKVNGVWTGLRRPGPERVVIADDDVRWPPDALREAVGLLDRTDVVPAPHQTGRPADLSARGASSRSPVVPELPVPELPVPELPVHSRQRSDHRLVDEAPAPVLPGLERADHRVVRGARVPAGVPLG